MDPRALEALRAIATHGSVTAAAAALHVTPSAVSQQVAGLQRAAGVQLTERVGRGLRLTPAGQSLAQAAVGVAVALERAAAACEEFRDSPGGVVRVSAFQSAAQLLLPGLLTRLAGSAITVECSDEDVAQRDFVALTDQIDVVVAHRPEGGSAWGGGRLPVTVVPLLREPLDVAVPVGHRLADRAEVGVDDLADETWISVREGFPVAGVLGAIAGAVVISGRGAAGAGGLRIAHRVNDFHVQAALVAAGHGIALLPRFAMAGVTRFGVRLVPLREARAARLIDAVMRPDVAARRAVVTVVDALMAEAAAVQAAVDGDVPAALTPGR